MTWIRWVSKMVKGFCQISVLPLKKAEDLYTKLVSKLRTKRVKEKKVADEAKEKKKKEYE